jgi:hypothetical protein
MAVREITVTDPHLKEPGRYRGVNLSSLLSAVGTPSGEALRGKSLALHVQVEASDGHVACFSLAEVDPGTGSTDALLAFEYEGKPLGADLGPLRLVVPTDKRAARWVRQVEGSQVSWHHSDLAAPAPVRDDDGGSFSSSGSPGPIGVGVGGSTLRALMRGGGDGQPAPGRLATPMMRRVCYGAALT